MNKIKKFIMSLDMKNVNIKTWVRLVQMVISMLILICKMFNVIIPPVDDNVVLNVLALLFAVVSGIQCYWSNNSFTEAAHVADIYMEYYKHNVTEADIDADNNIPKL